MGKRELLLVVVFVVLGLGVYQVTAPASEPGAPGFSIGRLVQFAKAHFQGAQVRRTVERTARLPVPAAAKRLTLRDTHGPVTVEASDRPDIEVTADIVIGGLDEADVSRQERAVRLVLEPDGEDVQLTLTLDESGRRPRYELHVRVPRTLALQVEGGRGRVEAVGVAGVQLHEYRGDLRTEALTGPVTGELREGRAEFGPGATLKLELKQVLLRADAPASVTLTAERGVIDIMDATGPVSIEQDYARMDIRGSGGPVTVTGDGGTITLREISHPLKIDATRLTVTAELERPVETTIDVEDDTVELTLPREGGVQLDAAVTDGDLRLPTSLDATTTDNRQSIVTALGGGGPLVKVHLTRGELRIRTRATPAT